ncbi:toll/interleukin-1 receptor domain-containing protein [Listeria booriae]|uniref:toll/interleukin-1 receptor domain-containing protein n=1 Tax=Listeria booriae TaxID=1552123 RepID=UPI00164E783E|nr:toll/interleukin-1 receptor domain-containing protein [Listeria booriae]MBC6301518.1 toll/interleukin-1 receptor domain-containing protein [Listeria booriae]MCD2208788.1 toll/interleukin-1 receptor domain-containing protein [Listeria booriae]
MSRSRCTAPVYGHRTANARNNCPACGGRSNSYSYPHSAFSDIYSGSTNYSSSKQSTKKASWSPVNSTVTYTDSQIRTLTPVRGNIEKRSTTIDLRDVFLCHAWDDRKESAKELHDLLESKGVTIWFSEKDVPLGSPLLREIDKGLVNSRIGIVLVTPSFLKRIKGEGIADKELSALLARDLLVPIIHNTTYDSLREVSPLLGSRSGLSTLEESLDSVAAKIAELVAL